MQEWNPLGQLVAFNTRANYCGLLVSIGREGESLATSTGEVDGAYPWVSCPLFHRVRGRRRRRSHLYSHGSSKVVECQLSTAWMGCSGCLGFMAEQPFFEKKRRRKRKEKEICKQTLSSQTQLGPLEAQSSGEF